VSGLRTCPLCGSTAARVLDRRLCRDIENMERLPLDEPLILQTYSIKP
jgi:hypothetical protein